MSSVLLEVKDLKKYFKTPAGDLHAVDGVSFQIENGNTLGVVGESGCGKSTLGRVILQLIPATGGEVFFEDESILNCSKAKLKDICKKMQIIFQDPYSSLNPRMTVSEIIAEPLIVNKVFQSKKDMNKYILATMEKVGLSYKMVNTYPHELDGGRRQRIGIARALCLEPKFIVCDEPVSALDVSIQAQILNLMMDLQEDMNLTYMFITHDLSVVKHISDDIMVMYLGKCVEKAPSKELFKNPLHPYTKALLGAIPVPNIKTKYMEQEVIKGEVVSPINPKPGCRFATRCKYFTDKCVSRELPLKEVAEKHFIACTLYA